MLDYAKYRLGEWGRWSREAPSLRSSMGLWFRAGRGGAMAMPAHIEEVNSIINHMDREPRIVIIVHYCRVAHWSEKARSLDMGKTRYYELLDNGHWFVKTELDTSSTPRLTRGMERLTTSNADIRVSKRVSIT